MEMNDEVVKLIAQIAWLKHRKVKLSAKIDNICEELKQKYGVVL